MKKIFVIIFAVIISAMLAACGSTEPTITPIQRIEAQRYIENIIPEETTAPTEEVEETIPAETHPVETTLPAPALNSSSIGTKPTIPAETTPTPTEPVATEPAETIPAETAPTEPEETEPAPTEPAPKHTMITKTKIIDGMLVEYLACGNCEVEHIDEAILLIVEDGSIWQIRKIQSITVIDNDVWKIVLVPIGGSMRQWMCYFTNKTDRDLAIGISGCGNDNKVVSGGTKAVAYAGTTINFYAESGEFNECGFFVKSDNQINEEITATINIRNLFM